MSNTRTGNVEQILAHLMHW